jgi:phosphoribosylformylglycinamidine cyclo-ligase
MHRVFNCGIGMVVVVDRENERKAIDLLTAAGEQVFAIGRIESCRSGETQTVVS